MPLLSDGELLDDESRSGMPGGFFRGGNFEGIEEIGRGNMEIYGKEVGDGGKFQSLFWEISGMLFRNALKRISGSPCNVYKTNKDHLSPMRDSTFRIGQSGATSLTNSFLRIFFRFRLQK